MTFFALLIALLIEQIRPLPPHDRVWSSFHRLVAGALRWLPCGDGRLAAMPWLMLVGGAGVLTGLIHAQLGGLHPWLAFVFNVGMLYALLGFRYHEKMYSDIYLELSTGKLERARRVLGRWRGSHHDKACASELARLSIEHGLVVAHRSAFAPIFWFVLLPGPMGVVIYRLAAQLAEEGGVSGRRGQARSRAFARRAFGVIDWLPARLTALAFSAIGNFEDALCCWRQQSSLWPDRAAGILIAAGAGALGVRLGLPIHAAGGTFDRPEMGMGERADVHYMQKAARLVWRVLVLYVLIVALLGIAGWAGG